MRTVKEFIYLFITPCIIEEIISKLGRGYLVNKLRALRKMEQWFEFVIAITNFIVAFVKVIKILNYYYKI